MQTIRELTSRHAQSGRVEWIGVCPARRAPVQVVSEVEAVTSFGLTGDHHAKSGKSKRQVTLIQHEHLPVVAALTGRSEVPPELLRRNIAVSGISVLTLKEGRFRIGDVLLEGTGLCAPCSHMEEALGSGGYNAMRGHGGITARVLNGGVIRIGDSVITCDGNAPDVSRTLFT